MMIDEYSLKGLTMMICLYCVAGFKAFGACLSELLTAFVDRLTIVLVCGDDIPNHDFSFREEIKIERLPDPV